MGLVLWEVAFEGSVPDLERISAKVVELSGLPVKVTQLPHEDAMMAMRGELAFEVAPDNAIELYAYVPGAVKNWVAEDGREMLVPAAYGHVQGYNEVPGRPILYVQGYCMQEPTLNLFILRALEELGGQLEHPLSEESRALCDQPVVLGELERRERKSARNAEITHLIGAVFLPLSLLAVPFSILALPFQLTRRRMNQAAELAYEAEREPGEPEHIGRLKYAFMMLCALPSWLVMAVVMMMGAVLLIPCIPFYLVYRVVAYLVATHVGSGARRRESSEAGRGE